MKIKIVNFFEISFIFNCKGVSISYGVLREVAILPSSVSIPVLTTRATTRPLVILDPENNILV